MEDLSCEKELQNRQKCLRVSCYKISENRANIVKRLIFDEIPNVENNHKSFNLTTVLKGLSLKRRQMFDGCNSEILLNFSESETDEENNIDCNPYGEFSLSHNSIECICDNRKIFNKKLCYMEMTNSFRSRTFDSPDLLSLTNKYFKKALTKTKKVMNFKYN